MNSNILYTLFASILCLFQQVSAQCDLSFSSTNTGSNMSVLLTPPSLAGSSLSPGDSIGVFFLNSLGEEVCGGSDEWTGGMIQFAAWGDDATSPEKDGFANGEALVWKALTSSGELYDVESTPAVMFAANDISNISALTYVSAECGETITTGCVDELACNYNSSATQDDGSCTYIDGICETCVDGVIVDNDADNDNVCDADEIQGCTDASASNYSSEATDDDGSCEYGGCTDDTYMEYDSSANVDDGSCATLIVEGCTDINATNYDSNANTADGSCVFDAPYIYITSPIDGGIYSGTEINITYEVQNIDIGLPSVYPDGGHIKYSIDGGDEQSEFNPSGVITEEFTNGEHTIQFILYNNVSGNIEPWLPAVETTVTFTVGTLGCTDATALNYNSEATVDDDSCEYTQVVEGCTDATALNYNSEATDDDGSCEYTQAVEGCTDATASNYNSEATDDDGSCEYATATCNLSFSPINTGSNMSILLTPPSLAGSSLSPGDSIGVFYLNSLGDEVCGGSDEWTGGMIQFAAWGDDSTTPEKDGFANGEALVWKALTSSGNLYDVESTPAVTFAANDISNISSLTYVSAECGETIITGCVDDLACNYNSAATEDDGSCTYIDGICETCVDGGIVDNDADDDAVCDADEIEGCTDSEANNYNSEATEDDGSCEYTQVVEGCTDATASNYNSAATDDDGSCEYDTTSEDCVLPGVFTGNTGANMTMMFLPDFIASLPLTNENAYIVALTSSGLVVGSAPVYGVTQNSLAVWGDDSITEEIDGALSEETVSFQLVDGGDLYDIDVIISYSTGSVSPQSSAAIINLVCSGTVQQPVYGCTDANYIEYDPDATDDDGSYCITLIVEGCMDALYAEYNSEANVDTDPSSCVTLIVEGCTDALATNYNSAATEDDGSCEYDPTPEDCVLPAVFTGNTGANMTMMFLPDFIASLPLTNENAYIVALTSSGLVVGSAPVYGVTQNSLAVWGDDSITEEIDGALSEETVSFQLVDGGDLYDIDVTVSYSTGLVSPQSSAAIINFVCSGTVQQPVYGCTDANYIEYDPDATDDDGSYCITLIVEGCMDALYAEYNSEANVDTDPSSCVTLIVEGCTDALATNYNLEATEDDGSCEYPPVVEGCTDAEANNYNSEANTDDGSCLYGLGGCTYEDAVNYNAEAAYDDGSCDFADVPYIYITSPIDGGIYSDTEINITYEVQNIDIGFPSVYPDGGHIKYSIDGGDEESEFDPSGVITQEFSNGEHTIQFILYNNVSGNIGLWSPAVETTVTFTVGPSGCMDPDAGNYNSDAVLDDGSCIENADLYFVNTNTASNHTLALLPDIGTINVDGIEVQVGDLLGVFYLSNGVYNCGGFIEWTGGMNALAAMGDDSTTPEQDGFLSGQEFVWAVQFAETGNSVFLEASYTSQGMNTFISNGISSVVSFNVMDFEGLLGCMDTEYVEYNPFASVDDGTCITQKSYGCMDNFYLEHWDYNSTTFTISELEVVVNTDDGSCQTLIIEGCTNTGYLDYCEVCNVADTDACETMIEEGCMDPVAENYDALANVENGICEYDICIQFEVNNFVVDYSTLLGEIVLSYDVVNIGDQVVFTPDFDIELSSSAYFLLANSDYSSTQMYPEDTVTIQVVITNDLTTLPSYVLLTGQVNLTGTSEAVNGEVASVACLFNFNEELVPTQHVGCTSSTAFNYEEEATIDDGSCIENLSASIISFDPVCSYEYGSAIVYVTGGFPPYSATATSSTEVPVEFDDEGVANLSDLDEGDYVIEIHDDSEIVSFYNFTITLPSELEVEAVFEDDGLLTSTVIPDDPVLYQWLLNGVSIPGATNEIHYPQVTGLHQVYVETALGCGDYSEEVMVYFIGINELSENSLTIYPNPAYSNITLSLNQLNGKTTVSFTDVLGQELHKVTLDSEASVVDYTFDISELPNGLYFINVNNNSNQLVKRFVKN